MTTDTQLQLIPDEPLPEPLVRTVLLADLPDTLAAPPPTLEMIGSVKRWGVIEPIILLHPIGWSGAISTCRIEDGRGRVLASRAAGLETIPAHIYPVGLFAPGVLTIVLARCRRDNRIAELEIVERLIAEHHSLDDICVATGKNKAEIASLLKLQELAPPLRQALKEGKITTNSAERAARLIPVQQERLAAHLEENGKITADDVGAARKTERDAAADLIPWAELTARPTDWRPLLLAQVRGLIASAPQGTPEEIHGHLRCLLIEIESFEERSVVPVTEEEITPPKRTRKKKEGDPA